MAVTKNKDWRCLSSTGTIRNGPCNGTAVLLAKIRSPRRKTCVENTVRINTEHIPVEMEEVELFILVGFNAVLWENYMELGLEMSFKGVSRRQLFEQEERPPFFLCQEGVNSFV